MKSSQIGPIPSTATMSDYDHQQRNRPQSLKFKHKKDDLDMDTLKEGKSDPDKSYKAHEAGSDKRPWQNGRRSRTIAQRNLAGWGTETTTAGQITGASSPRSTLQMLAKPAPC